jgi:hypothetical protein
MTAPQVTYKVKMAGDKRSEYSRFGAEVIEDIKKTFTYVYISNPEDLPDG